MANQKVKTGQTIMRPKARLISLLGDELISDERVAVVELVKNAYDADATKVTVKFEFDDMHIPVRLIISDDGHGMSLDTVLNAWFEPGTNQKNESKRSPAGRKFQGAKGVGRFAAARLGTELFLETFNRKSKESTTVLLEWGDFDDNSYLDEIQITYESIESKNKNGTTLTIEGLDKKKSWDEEDYSALHRRLSRLISPFNEVKNYSITLDIPIFPEFTGEVETHELTTKPKYKLKGSLTKNGLVTADLFVDDKKHKSYLKHKVSGEGETVSCGEFEFEIRAWDRDIAGLGRYMLEYDMNISSIRKIISNYCGVSIYRDGFRVHPYGELGDDWLSLDTRSRLNPTLHLANNQVIASIKISKEKNENLKDRTTREGLVHTSEFDSLKDWFKRIISLLEGERYRLRPREDKEPEYITTLYEPFDMRDVVLETNKQLGNKHPVTKLVKEKDQEVRHAVKALQEHYSRVLLAAGLGQMVDLVIHEIGAPLGRINRELIKFTKLIEEFEFNGNDRAKINKSFKNISGWLENIGNLRLKLDPKSAGKRGRATSFNVTDEINGNISLYENLLDKQKIKVSLKSPRDGLIVHMSRFVLGQIVANLIDNSIYWLTRHYGDGKGGEIDIQVRQINGGFKLIFSDNGPGIQEEDENRVFEQYFTTKPNGMGLGLYIARQVIEPYGKIIYKEDCKLPGACFEVIFARKVGLSS